MISDKSFVWRTYANVLKINTKYFNLTMKVIIQWKGEKGEQRHIYGREMEGKEDQEKGLRGKEARNQLELTSMKGQKALIKPDVFPAQRNSILEKKRRCCCSIWQRSWIRHGRAGQTRRKSYLRIQKCHMWHTKHHQILWEENPSQTPRPPQTRKNWRKNKKATIPVRHNYSFSFSRHQSTQGLKKLPCSKYHLSHWCATRSACVVSQWQD